MLREHAREPGRVQPAMPAQPARIAQILLGVEIVVDLVAMHRRAAVLVVERIRVARHLHPAQARPDLRAESLAARLVGLAHALGLVELVVDRVGHVLAAQAAVGRHAPIRAGRRLIALDRPQRRPDLVFHGRRNSDLLHPAQEIAVELVAVRVIGLLVGPGPPFRLQLDLPHDVGVFVELHLDLFAVVGRRAVVIVAVVLVIHRGVLGVCHMRQSGASASWYVVLRLPAPTVASSTMPSSLAWAHWRKASAPSVQPLALSGWSI